jgi:hypothetical protein
MSDRLEQRARRTPPLLALVGNLLAEQAVRHPDSLAVRSVSRYLATCGDDGDARRFPELISALRSLLALGGEGAALEHSRGWLSTHCRGCGVELDTRRDACRDCLAEWKNQTRKRSAA